jgi:hypothetical protein
MRTALRFDATPEIEAFEGATAATTPPEYSEEAVRLEQRRGAAKSPSLNQ